MQTCVSTSYGLDYDRYEGILRGQLHNLSGMNDPIHPSPYPVIGVDEGRCGFDLITLMQGLSLGTWCSYAAQHMLTLYESIFAQGRR
jgi:hypothetical protein